MIVNITTQQFTTDEKVDNIQHTVVMSWTDTSDVFNTISKTFINDINGLLSFITTNKDKEER